MLSYRSTWEFVSTLEKCREASRVLTNSRVLLTQHSARTRFIFLYSQLPPCGHPAITDTSLLRTKEKSAAETIKKYMKTALAITDARYYGHTDTSPGPKLKFSLLFSRYNGHFRHVFKNWCDLNSCIWQNNSKIALC